MKRSILKGFVAALALLCAAGAAFAAPVVVTYSRWAGGNEIKDFQALVDKFNSTVGKQKNIEVKFEPLPWGNYWDKLKTTMLSGGAPDVISLSNAGENGAYLSRGVFLNLSKMPGAKDVIGALAKPAVQSLTVKGNVLGVPVGLGVRAMIYNKKLLDAAGIKHPDPVKPMTWEEFAAMAAKLSKKDAKGAYTHYTGLFSMDELTDSIVEEWGARFLDDRNNPTKVLINNKAGVEALTFAANLHKNNVVPPDTGEWQTPYGNPDNAVVTGSVAFMLSGPWGFSNFGPDAKVKVGDVGTCPFPVFKGKEKLRATRGYINGLAIYRKSKVAKEAWEFVKWMVSKEGQLEFTKTGDLPANTAALAEAQANAGKIYTSTSAENYRAYFSDLPYVISGPTLPSGEWTALFTAVLGDMRKGIITPADAAKRLESEGNEVLAAMWE